jgi:tetratricopeptide (TPR) repeat protein
MPTDPSRLPLSNATGSIRIPAAQSTQRAIAHARLPRRLRLWKSIVLAGGLVAAGMLAAFAWSELHPAALDQAEAAYRRNNLQAALQIALAHLERRPFSRTAAALAARCLYRLGEPDRAEIYYQKAGSVDRDDRHIRAYALVVNNRREPAIQAYQEILLSQPDDVLALSRMGAVLISQNRWDEALKAADRLIKVKGGAVIGHTLAGVVHHNMREPEQAIDDFSRVLALDPQLEQMPLKPRSMFWVDLGANLLSIGRTQEARRYLMRAIDERGDATVLDLLGHACYLQGEFADAENYWRRALEWEEDRFGTWWRIGKLELQRGRPEQAIEPLRRAAALEPKAAGPLYSLSLAFRRLGRKQEADRLKEQAERLRAATTSTPRERNVVDSLLLE